jgi:hypothetical protein
MQLVPAGVNRVYHEVKPMLVLSLPPCKHGQCQLVYDQWLSFEDLLLNMHSRFSKVKSMPGSVKTTNVTLQVLLLWEEHCKKHYADSLHSEPGLQVI